MKRVVRNSDQFRRFAEHVLSKLPDDFGKPYTIEFRRFHRVRSVDQNAKLHAIIRDIAQHLGWEREDELKEYLKDTYGLKRARNIGDQRVVVPISTTLYNVVEMSEFIDRVYQFGAEYGVEWEYYEPGCTV